MRKPRDADDGRRDPGQARGRRSVMNPRDPEAYERFENLIEIPMLVLSVAFIPIVLIPEFADLSPGAEQGLDFASWLIWGAFAIEYVGLFYLAPDRWQMFRTHLLDLFIVIAPFLRPLRLARLARLLRAGSGLGRVVVSVRSITARRGFSSFLGLALVVIVLCAVTVWGFERQNPESNIQELSDALWWAVVTTTTVGYGDFSPLTPEGRAIATLLMVLGVGVLGVITANIAAYFVGADDEEDFARIEERLDRIERLLEQQVGTARPGE